MRIQDKALTPQIAYVGLKADIEALSVVLDGMEAIATDTSERGAYLGGAWIWSALDASGGGGGGGGVASVTGDGVDNADPANPVLSYPTPTNIGLGNVDNTSDINKPVSTAQAAADAVVQAAAEAYADGLVVGLWDDRGSFDASGGAYPSSGGSGTAGAILKGDIWTVSVAGTLPTGVVVDVGDLVRALVDSPGNTQANWAVTQNNIGYTPESTGNKTNDIVTYHTSTVKYPSVKAVYDWVLSTISSSVELLINKSTSVPLGSTSDDKYPTTKAVYDWVTGLFSDLLVTGNAIYGDGTDGAITFNGSTQYDNFAILSGSTYTLQRDIYATTVSVSIGVTIITAGYRIFASTSIANYGTIHNDGTAASNNTGGSGGLAGFFPAGVTGGNGVASGAAAAAGTSPTWTNNGNLVGSFGGRGAGAWLNATQYLGATSLADFSGTDPYLSSIYGGHGWLRNLAMIMQKYLYASTAFIPSLGGGGGGKSAVGTTLLSGGGGGGGGCAMLASKSITNMGTGTIRCNGGNGAAASGTGANAGGGGGGSGGILWFIYNTFQNFGTIQTNGGTGGSSVALGTTPLKAAFRLVPTTMTTVSTGVYRIKAALNKNTLYFLAIHVQGVLTPTSIQGAGLTWTLVNSVDYNTIASPTYRLLLYSAYGTPTNDWNNSKFTIRFASAPTAVSMQLIEVQNATGTIVQSSTNRNNSATSLTVTLSSAFGSSNAAAFGVFARVTSSTPTAGSGFVKLAESAAPLQFSELGYNDTTVDASWVPASACAGIACEIQAVGSMESGIDGNAGSIIYIQN